MKIVGIAVVFAFAIWAGWYWGKHSLPAPVDVASLQAELNLANAKIADLEAKLDAAQAEKVKLSAQVQKISDEVSKKGSALPKRVAAVKEAPKSKHAEPKKARQTSSTSVQAASYVPAVTPTTSKVAIEIAPTPALPPAASESPTRAAAAAPPPARVPHPTLELKVSPTTIHQGEYATIMWDADNATKLELGPGFDDTVSLHGQAKISPTMDTTYSAVATGPGGVETQYVDVHVLPNKEGKRSKGFFLFRPFKALFGHHHRDNNDSFEPF